jgi:hypothetical protein
MGIKVMPTSISLSGVVVEASEHTVIIRCDDGTLFRWTGPQAPAIGDRVKLTNVTDNPALTRV